MVEYEPIAPELRAAIIAEAIKRIAELPGPASYFGPFLGVLAAIGRPEEEIGPEIGAAIRLLVLSGLVESNGLDRSTGLFSVRADTTLKASPALTTYVFHETMGYERCDDSDGEGL